MNFVVLIDNDNDAITIEKCMKLLNIDFECDIIDYENLIYEFTIDDRYKKLIDLIIDDINISIVNFISN
jgi:hypothetical protein